MITSGVFPCYENQFQVNVAASGATDNFVDIADLTSFSVSFTNGIETWNPFTEQGWQRALMTAKAVSITVQGKRNVGDAGNDYIAGLAFKNGRDAESDFKWTFPDGTVVLFADAVISVTALGSGDSTAVGPLEFEVQSNGKPTVTPAA